MGRAERSAAVCSEPVDRSSHLARRPLADNARPDARGHAQQEQSRGPNRPSVATPASTEQRSEQDRGCGDTRPHDNASSAAREATACHEGFPICSRLSVAELRITERLDIAMAAAAMIGLSRPAAAIGMAAVLYANA